LIYPADDGIVVEEGVMERITVPEYFRQPESMRPMELVYGVVREPPAPRYGHQSIVTRLTALLDAHVRERDLGRVCVSPVDVVLDEPAALVVQPDIVFVARERLAIISDRIWGAPDLVVQGLSPRTAARDRVVKLEWYRQYGVRECWLVDAQRRAVEVVSLTAADAGGRSTYSGVMPLRSPVLPSWNVPADDIFTP
jgi:Uma2 family endonuclease